DSTGGTTGQLAWSFTVDNSAVQFLKAGEVLTQVYNVKLSDGTTADDVTKQVTVTITGSNDAAAVVAVDVSGAVQEDVNVGTTGALDGKLTDQGSLTFTDVDLKDVHTVSATLASDTDNLGRTPTELGTFEVHTVNDSTGGTTGQLAWSFTVDNSAVQFLKAGEVLTQVYNVKLSDGTTAD